MGISSQFSDKITNAELSIKQYGFEDCAPGHDYGPIKRDHYLMHIVASGRGEFRFRGITHRLGPRTTFLITPGEDAYYRADDRDPWRYYWIGFSGTQVERVLKRAGFIRGEVYVQDIENFDDILAILESVNDYSLNTLSQRFIVEGYLYLFLGQLMGERGGDEHGEIVSDALDYIHAHYGERLEIAQLAAELGIDRSNLYRHFVEEVGVSPREYLLRFRLGESLTMFSQAKLTLSEIAYRCGFENYAHYSGLFARRYGMSPREYRAKYYGGINKNGG